MIRHHWECIRGNHDLPSTEAMALGLNTHAQLDAMFEAVVAERPFSFLPRGAMANWMLDLLNVFEDQDHGA